MSPFSTQSASINISTFGAFADQFMLEQKEPSCATLLRVGAAAAAVRTDNGLYTRRVGSDCRKLPGRPLKSVAHARETAAN